MTDNVEDFPGISRFDGDSFKAVNKVNNIQWDQVVVVGFDHAGEMHIISNIADGGDMLWLLERAKHKLMLVADKLENG